MWWRTMSRRQSLDFAVAALSNSASTRDILTDTSLECSQTRLFSGNLPQFDGTMLVDGFIILGRRILDSVHLYLPATIASPLCPVQLRGRDFTGQSPKSIPSRLTSRTGSSRRYNINLPSIFNVILSCRLSSQGHHPIIRDIHGKL